MGKNWLLPRGERAEETREGSVGETRQDFEGRRSVARVALPTLTEKLLHRRHAKVNVVVLQGQEIIIESLSNLICLALFQAWYGCHCCCCC